MIDLDKATSEFDKYVRKYYMTNKIIKLKYHHTYTVVQLSEELAKSLNLSDEDIKLAKLIGLLHDIARFEQYTRYKTLSDSLSIDHGDFGVEILTENNFIRKFIEDDKYDNLILTCQKENYYFQKL